MANTSRINGFRPVFHLGGAHIQARLYQVPASDGTALFLNDVVKLASGSDTIGASQSVTRAAAGDAVIGVCVGFLPNPLNLNIDGQSRLASTLRYVWVTDDPMIVYEAETSNGTLVAGNVGKNINHAVGSGSATTSSSGASLDVATIATTATLTFKILQFSSRIDNDDTAASSKVYVKINNHQFAASTGTAGV